MPMFSTTLAANPLSALAGSTARGAEVVAYDAARKLALVLGPNGVDFLVPATGARIGGIGKADVQGTGGDPTALLGTGNSVAIFGNTIAVAFDGAAPGVNGYVALFQLNATGTTATWLKTVTGATAGSFVIPDMVTFTPDGSKVLVAIEGEPKTDYSFDAPGGVGVIDVASGALKIADFTGFDASKAALKAAGVRLAAPSDGTTPVAGQALVSKDVEPEYITVSPDGSKAYVTLQEANSLAVVDLTGANPVVTAILPFGTKDHSLPGNGMDTSDQDSLSGANANIRTVPVKGMYMPDAIASFTSGFKTYLVTANEGDAREYTAFTDVARLNAKTGATYTIQLDPGVFGANINNTSAEASTIRAAADLGRLNVSRVDGDTDNDGDIDVIHSFGGRSFSIWTIDNGKLMQTYDSGDLIERTLKTQYPSVLDDTRSDDKGPEPEHVTLGTINGQLYAFVGLERATAGNSVIMAFEIDGPADVKYAGTVVQTGTGAQAPEAFAFVPAAQSSNGVPMLLVPNETAGVFRSAAVNDGPISFPTATGPSTTQTPYLQALQPNVRFVSLLSAGDTVPGGAASGFVGVPDGLGAFSNGDGTVTVLVNHEITSSQGIVRAHGLAGSFVSKLIVDAATLQVKTMTDLATQLFDWDTAGGTYKVATAALSRLCSADLPDITAFYNAASGKGTQDRIYMNGEESGVEGRPLGWIVTGADAGKAYELPRFGNMGFENLVARPTATDKTIVMAMDDGTGGQVYLYIGDKQATGTAIEKAGLTNGLLFGIKASFSAETNAGPLSGSFTLAPLGDVSSKTGAQLEADSITAGVTSFFRPEDGAWDTVNPNRFYFQTTNNVTSPSRLWALDFVDPTDPTKGGTITALLDGTEGQRMLDNLAVTKAGGFLPTGTTINLEDVGNNVRNGRIWSYDPATDKAVQIAWHDPARFGNDVTAATAPFTQDEESSGVIDVTSLFGNANTNAFLIVDQAHYAIATPGIVEGGQLLVMYVDRPQQGSAGNDSVNGGWFADTLYGFGGNDVIAGGDGNDLLIGGAGLDTLMGGAGTDQLYGEAGNDVLDGGTGEDLVVGGIGDDQLAGGDGKDTLYGEDGADTLRGGLGEDFLAGGNGNDSLGGDDANDTLFGEGGDDVLDGGAGDDFLAAGVGNDQLNGGDGKDTLFGESGGDTVRGGAGDDYLSGGIGDDLMSGDDGNDTMYGEADNDTLEGNAGNDYLAGGLGNDWLYGGDGIDILFGEAGADNLFGGDGNDYVDGGEGGDYLVGGAGNDMLLGGLGADALAGGVGADYFAFGSPGEGSDLILDFSGAEGDKIYLFAAGFGGGLAPGALAADRFVSGSGPTANQAFGQFLFNTASGQLSWDADGTGAGAAVQIASLFSSSAGSVASVGASDLLLF